MTNIAPDKKNRIIAVATDLFAHFGYQKTSVNEIAREANIGKATIYYYFQSKEDIFLEAVQIKAEELFECLREQLAAQDSFEGKLSSFLRLPLKYIYENMPILLESMKQLPLMYLEKLEELHNASHNRMFMILQEIMDFGKQQGIINEEISSERFSEIINDWFLIGDTDFVVKDIDRLMRRIERDHELIIKLIMYGIIKRK